MKYRKVGSLDWKVSALGFGAMRLPARFDIAGGVKKKEAIEIIRSGIDQWSIFLFDLVLKKASE